MRTPVDNKMYLETILRPLPDIKSALDTDRARRLSGQLVSTLIEVGAFDLSSSYSLPTGRSISVK